VSSESAADTSVEHASRSIWPPVNVELPKESTLLAQRIDRGANIEAVVVSVVSMVSVVTMASGHLGSAQRRRFALGTVSLTSSATPQIVSRAS